MNQKFLNACTIGNIEKAAKLLKDPKVNPAYQNNQPIISASKNGHVNVVRLLMNDPRVDPSANDNEAIKAAIETGHIDMIELLSKDPRVKLTDGSARSVAEVSKALSDSSDEGTVFSFFDRPDVPLSKNPMKQSTHDNIFKFDAEDAQTVVEYADEILQYNFDKELSEYNDGPILSEKINVRMFSILVDWMIDVVVKFKLTKETYFQAVYIIKNCLQLNEFRDLPSEKLQLVGVTALYIASKNEEIYPPDIGRFVYIADKAFTKAELIEMEMNILKAIQFKVNYALPILFLRYFSKANRAEMKTYQFTLYLSEYAAVSYDIVSKLRPSQIVAGCVYLANHSLSRPLWNDELAYYSQINQEEAQQYAETIYKAINKMAEKKAASRKYATLKLDNVSEIPILDPS